MKLAFAKHRVPELIRIIMMPGILVARGNWLMLQKISVPGSLPSNSVLGLIESRTNFANEIPTCIQSILPLLKKNPILKITTVLLFVYTTTQYYNFISLYTMLNAKCTLRTHLIICSRLVTEADI